MNEKTHLLIKGRTAGRTAALGVSVLAACAAVSGPPLPARAAAAPMTVLAAPVTSPRGGVILQGANGTSHYWYPDHLLGFCRLDANAASATGFSVNQSTCILFVNGAQIKPTQASYDPGTHMIYTPDMSSKSLGVVRLQYDPTLDGGNGGITLFGRTAFGGNCFGGNLPWGSAIGPDGNLYISFKRTPNIDRIVSPHIASQCSSVQTVGNASDGKKAFALAFDGNDLWEVDNLGLGVIPDAISSNCTGGCNAVSVLTGQVPTPTALAADPVNHVLYVGNATSVYAVPLSGAAPAVLQTGFSFVFGLAIDPSTLGVGRTPTLYGGEDQSNGTLPQTGTLFSM
jgi:hypothetical protein